MYNKRLVFRTLFAVTGVLLLIPLLYISFELGRANAQNNILSNERVPTQKPDKGGSGKKKKTTPTPTIEIVTQPVSVTPSSVFISNPVISNTPAPDSTYNTPSSNGYSWEIQSVSSMKETKDRICGQRSDTFIQKWVEKAKELGAGYVSIETPYDNPSCGSSIDYSRRWINAVRDHGLKVWHRHMPIAFEGIYDTPKVQSDYLSVIGDYIKNNSSDFQEGDIFTPIPEPQNGGISGVTHCSQNVCQFSSKEAFNKWLRDAIDVSEQAFSTVGLGGKIKIGYFGFDGFVAWGDNNPDWNGILEDSTVQRMGNITIDHYPELIGSTMDDDLKELENRYPGIPIIIGEWGSVGSGDKENQVNISMKAAKRSSVKGFNYWHMGAGGNESLINEDFSTNPQFDNVQEFFRGTK